MRLPLATAGCLVALAIGVPATAVAKTETVTKGELTASLSYRAASVGYEDVRLQVTRAGELVVDDPGPRFSRCRGDGCEFWPAFARGAGKSIFLRELDGDDEPEVLAELYTGGANCCRASRIYDFDASLGRYRRIDRNWSTSGHEGAKDLDRDGVAEIVSSDSRFEARFGCAACTPEPIRIFRLRGGGFEDVTRRFPGQVKRDLTTLRGLYRTVRRDPLAAPGVLAAVTADRYLLGRARAARRGLRTALRQGALRGARGQIAPRGRAYIAALLRFLERLGYRR